MKTLSPPKPLPAHFHIFEGDLFNDRVSRYQTPIRRRYEWTFSRIANLSQAKATLRAGNCAWPGGYPLFLITHDGAALCFDCARKKWRQIVWDFLNKASTGWRLAGCDVNYEDNSLHCDHCGEKIKSAYGND